MVFFRESRPGLSHITAPRYRRLLEKNSKLKEKYIMRRFILLVNEIEAEFNICFNIFGHHYGFGGSRL
jgi:hypothetical protein